MSQKNPTTSSTRHAPAINMKENPIKSQPDDSDALETVLSHIGKMGRYQYILVLAMMPFGFTLAYTYFVQMFVTATPEHWCWVPELEHLDMEVRRNLSVPMDDDDWDSCMTFDTNWTHVLKTMTPPDPSTRVVPCPDGWEFELEEIPYHTVVSEREWVCDDSINVPIAQSVFFGGCCVGALLFGSIADRYGRVPALVGANLIGCVGGVATIFTTSLWDFACCRFIAGMSYDSSFMLIYILVLEYVVPRLRTYVGCFSMAAYFGGGCVTLPWIALWISNWKYLLLATSLPMLTGAAAPFVVPESVRWLVSQGEINKAVKVLRKFERVNRITIPQATLDQFLASSSETHVSKELYSFFKISTLRNMMITMLVVFMSSTLIYDGTARMTEDLGLDFFVAFSISSATEIPAIGLVALVLNKWGRRKVVGGPLWIAGILFLIASLVPLGIPVVVMVTLCRFCISMSFNSTLMWIAEVFPTGIRATCCSIVHVFGYVSSTLSPHIVYSQRFWHPLPFIILSVVALIAGTLTMLLPETKGHAMPQTLHDGEKLVSETSLWHIRQRNRQQRAEQALHKET